MQLTIATATQETGNIQRRTIVAIPADVHSGSPFGLAPPGPWRLANGGVYVPNELQKVIQGQWVECWERVRDLRRGGRLIIAHAGDAVEGIHHDSSEIVSPRLDEHERMHEISMRQGMTIAEFDPEGDLLYYVCGTPAHVGEGAMSEENIARSLGASALHPGTAVNNFLDGRYVWPHLRMRVNGVLFDIAHQGPGPGSRAWLRGNILRWTLRSIYWDCLEQGVEIPRYWVRAHRHRWVQPEIHRGERGAIEGFLLPCWQAKTQFAYKVASHELFSHIGMLIFVVDEYGHSSWECKRIRVLQDDVQEV